jgi:hypothetical protein
MMVWNNLLSQSATLASRPRVLTTTLHVRPFGDGSLHVDNRGRTENTGTAGRFAQSRALGHGRRWCSDLLQKLAATAPPADCLSASEKLPHAAALASRSDTSP